MAQVDLSSADTNGNPLVALAVAVIGAILYVLNGIKWMVGWVTITIPSMIVRMLHYSLTISLTFPVLLTLFLASLGAAFFVIRYRYLARYTQLKEPALPAPSPPSLPADLPDLDLDLDLDGLSHGDHRPTRLSGSRRRGSAFHNYLDDFLSAIRIFGYLEKPVFHELSRHLQTRRLAAGETLEIGGGDFWCVVEGKVQVFAPSSSNDLSHPPSPDPFNAGKSTVFNGYHLLNEVSTGGTLSSLFSILNLFVEDVKISWTPPADDGPQGERNEGEVEVDPDETFAQTARPKKSRQNSDVSQLDEGTLGSGSGGMRSTGSAEGVERVGEAKREEPRMMRKRSSSLGETSTARASSPSLPGSSSPKAAEAEDLTATTPSFTSPSSRYLAATPTTATTRSHSPSLTSPPRPHNPHSRFTPTFAPLSQPHSRRQSQRPTKRQATGTAALKGSIARATTDTTLAVIPAEAFRKLTRKFPKASGTVVQVVLERFSRVTFMTAHKFLGLTKEILRSESALNAMVSHPLPRDFYTGGGMQALRDRFHPPARGFNTTQSSPNGRDQTEPSPVKSRDYFNYVPASPTVKAPSLPSITPRNAMTPATRASVLPQDLTHSPTEEQPAQGLAGAKPAEAPLPPPEPAVLSPEPAARQTSTFVRRHSAMRKMVAAGDLAMTRSTQEGGAYFRPTAQTPGLPRMDTWQGRVSGSTVDLNGYKDDKLRIASELEDESELREAVMVCIARSVGLLQPNVDDGAALRSFAPSMSASAISTPNSPMFPPHGYGSHMSTSGAGHSIGGGSARRAPFGNVLDMMNAASHNEGLLEGMLREAVLKGADREDDTSSISQSIHDSASLMAGTGDRGVLRELEGKVEVKHFAKGTQLVGEGEKCPGLYYVIDGFLEISLPGSKRDKDEREDDRPFAAALGQDDPRTPHPSFSAGNIDGEHLFTVKPGGIAGYLASLCHTDSYVNITAKTDVYVGFLPIHTLERIMERHPLVLLTLAKRLLSLLSPLVLHIDAALDWMQLGAKEVLYDKGAKATDFYIVINGRLRSLDKRGDSVEVLREYGQGDSIGELEVITGAMRTDTVHAIRDSELVRIPAALFDAISQKHPATTMQFLKIIAGRVRKAVKEQASTRIRNAPSSLTKDINLKTVCIIGRDRNVPVAQVAAKLKTSLEELGASTSYLDQGTVMRHLGRHAFARIGKLKIAGWLADQEQHHRIVLYVADTPPSSQWTLTCIRQADLVLVVGMGDETTLGEYEKLMLATKTTARKELILLHDERAVAPGSTRPWLKARPWVQAHHHVELPGVVITNKAPVPHDAAAIAAFKHLREEVRTRLKAYRAFRPLGRPRRPPHMNDFARIARRMCGKQIGLCLGGGGARGISHLGMLQALEEYGVPIDAIGGCSIGSFVGGLYARETDLMQAAARTKQFAGRMGSVLRILSDLTYPYASYTTGHEFNRGIYKAFFNTHIEDCWIPFFANSTNITHSRMEVHRTGYAWRYVRASMTLAGLLPPLSDNGDLLVDGGYMDNTPIGPLQSSGISDIIVVDVGGIDDTSPRNYGDSVSGWWILLNRFNPFYRRAVLSMTEVSGRLAYVSSFKTLEDVKNTPGVLYLAMPVQQYETLGGFKQFKEVFDVGLEAGREQLRKWKEEGRLVSGLVDDKKGRGAWERGNRLRRMSI